jgi:hypothetical protein
MLAFFNDIKLNYESKAQEGKAAFHGRIAKQTKATPNK